MSRSRRRKRKTTTRVVAVVLVLLVVVMGFNVIRLYQKNQVYAAKQEALEQQLEDEKARKEDLSAYEEFTKTMDYVEQVAREKLGMVFGNEIIFKSDE
ncbi:MAG: septum formation initiator family protein [Lachnospiraceae bacterium]|nr:septum formation initiator family protein [Lachnospiraceae bacterium]